MNDPVQPPVARKRAPRAPRAKVVAVPAAAPVPPVTVPAAPAVKQKLVRDSFTFPENEYAQIETLKSRVLALAHHAKKSEILRAGVQLLSALPDAGFWAALKAVPSLKSGRPKQEPAAPVAAVAQGGKKQGR